MTDISAALKWDQIPIIGGDNSSEIVLNVKNHAVVHNNGVLYLLGGSYNERMDIIMYNIVKKTWSRAKYQDEMSRTSNNRRFSFRRRRNSLPSTAVMTGPKPKCRNGHTATLVKRVGSDGVERSFIYLIGGWLGEVAASRVLVLNISNPGAFVWVDVNEMEDSPGPCNMHSAEFIPDKNEIYVFRGGDGSEYLNDLHALNVNTLTWRKVETNGVAPEPRADHASAYMHSTKEMFVFGGWNGSSRLNDFYILNTETSTWSRPAVGGSIPARRAGMTLNAVRDRLYLFGGNGAQSAVCNDLHVFDRSRMTFLEIENTELSISDHSGPSFSLDGSCSGSSTYGMDSCNPNCVESVPKLSVHGHGPPRRAGHTATVVGRYIYITGGSSGSEYRNDCYVLDTDNLVLPPEKEPRPIQKMSSQLKEMCNSEEFSDVVFIVEGRRIYAHKIILSLTSELYRAMFRNEFREKSTARPEIEIPNCTYDVFLSILQYMYTGDIDLAFNPTVNGAQRQLERILEVLEMADHLLLDHLKQRCERALLHAVNPASFESLMQFAKDSNAKHLEAICSHYERNRLS